MTALDDARAEEILAFWFGDLNGPYAFDAAAAPRWFQKDDDFDEEIRRRFGPLVEAAQRGELDEDRPSPRRRLAHVILLDQMSRNAFRDTPRMYAGDRRSLRLAKEGIASGDHEKLRFIERTFLYMPLMHSEAEEDQRECVRRWRGLISALPDDMKQGALGKLLENGLRYAQRHEEIIVRFGRFPHRNEILGRETTPAEREFLKEEGSSF